MHRLTQYAVIWIKNFQNSFIRISRNQIRFQSCMESETSWDCRTQRVRIRGQRVGIRGQRRDGHEDRINITIGVTFTFSYI